MALGPNPNVVPLIVAFEVKIGEAQAGAVTDDRAATAIAAPKTFYAT